MKVTKETTGNCEVTLTIELDRKKEDQLMQKAAKRLARKYPPPGFRKGKAPYKFILNRYGVEAVQEEASEDLLTKVFADALEEAEINPFDQPQLENLEWEPARMTVKIPTQPEVELGNYRDLRMEVIPVEVPEEEIEHRLEHMAEDMTTYEPVEDRPVQAGDLVSFEYIEKDLEADDDEEADSYEDEVLLGEDGTTAVYKELGDNLVGMAIDETKTFSYTYPAGEDEADDDEDEDIDDEADDDREPRPVEITLTVTGIKAVETIEYDDEFAALVGDYDSMDDLRASIEAELRTQHESTRDAELATQAADLLVERAEKIVWPEVMEKSEIDGRYEEKKAELARSGMSMADFLRIEEMTEEEYRDSLRETAVNSLKKVLVMDKLADLEDIEVDGNHFAEQVNYMVQIMGGTKEAEKMMTSDSSLRYLHHTMRTEQVRVFLSKLVKGEIEAEEAAAAEAKAKAEAEAEAHTEAEETAEIDVDAEATGEATVDETVAEQTAEPETTEEDDDTPKED